jgi:hypothetical protein
MHPKQPQALYNDLRENDMTKPEKQPIVNYPDRGYIRVLIFELPDGACMGFNYQYLINVSCAADGQILELHFTTHTVQLKGVRLDMLYHQLTAHLPRIIRCRHERFNGIAAGEPVVNSIFITPKQGTAPA